MNIAVEVRIDPSCDQTRAVITARELTPELSGLIALIEGERPSRLAAYTERGVELLKPEDVLRVYAEQQKVFAQTKDARYALRLRLYEAEERLSTHGFVRISNAELINLRRAKRLDLTFSGTILIELDFGITCFVSRRFVGKIKLMLGV